jgi:hypothetical protein
MGGSAVSASWCALFTGATANDAAASHAHAADSLIAFGSSLALPVRRPEALLRFMISRKSLTIAGLVAIGAGVSWWLFGFSRIQFRGTTMTSYRFFGRVTRIDSTGTGDDGKTQRERLVFTWSKPFRNRHWVTGCEAIFPESWEDRNGDGRWDTWIYRVGPDPRGECQVEYRVDTKNSGRPDWVFRLPDGEYKKANAMMIERRGF